MPDPPLPDPLLVRRIRQLVADREEGTGAAGPAATPGWVPAPPTPPTTAAHEVPPAVIGGGRAARVLTLPGFLRGARVQVERRALLALVAVVLASALLVVARVAAATAQGQPVPVDPNPSGRLSRTTPAGAAPASPPGGTGTSASAPPRTGSEGPLHVHVVGQVASPRVVTVQPSSRVADAIAGAGGALPGADLARVNLARLVTDGEQVHVPASGEAPPPAPPAATPSPPAVALVDLNTADLAALDSLPGVGPVLAQRIVDWRAAHGRFSTLEELGEVSGIGDKLLEQLRPRVTVGGGPRR